MSREVGAASAPGSPERTDAREKEAKALYNLGATCASVRQNTRAIECYQQSLAISSDIEPLELIASICNMSESVKDCLLHWQLGAVKVKADGSFSLLGGFSGKNDLLLLLIDAGKATTFRLRNIEPVRAGQLTKYDAYVAK